MISRIINVATGGGWALLLEGNRNFYNSASASPLYTKHVPPQICSHLNTTLWIHDVTTTILTEGVAYCSRKSYFGGLRQFTFE